MAVVKDVSVSDAIFISVINNTLKDFTHVECLREKQKNWIKKLWSKAKMSLQSFPTTFGKSFKNLLTLSTRTNIFNEWKSWHLLHTHSGLSNSYGHNERLS